MNRGRKLNLIMLVCLLLLPAVLVQGQPTQQKTAAVKVNTTLQGEIGEAEQAAINRFFQPPFTTLGWLRADLTNETVSPDDRNNKSVMKRPFKQFSGDISGRYLELMALLSNGDVHYHPALQQMISQVSALQKADGTFGWGKIDWNAPIDYDDKGRTPLMMPALWGNGRMLCGLIASYKTFKDPTLLASAKKLGDFYIHTANRFMDTARIAEYKKSGTYASGFVTCYFNGFEGLVKLYQLTKEDKYLKVSEQMAAFLLPFDQLPLDHTHGMLCNQFALLLLYEQTKRTDYLQRVEQRWEQMVKDGYSDPSGGVLESARIGYARDEGCAEADWLRVNLELYKITANARYLDMSERLLQNHYLANQNSSGGFGHRFILNDNQGAFGINRYSEEATWCCDFHDTQGFELLKPFVCMVTRDTIAINYAMDFTSAVNLAKGRYSLISKCDPFSITDTIFSQRIELADTKNGRQFLSVRLPSWATSLKIKNNDGSLLATTHSGAYYKTTKALTAIKSATIEYSAPIRAEDRRGNPVNLAAGKSYPSGVVLRHGPKLLMANGVKNIPELSITKNGIPRIPEGITSFEVSPRPLRKDTLSSVYVFSVKTN